MFKKTKTILVIDDDPQNRLVAVEQLMQAPEAYKVLSAPSGEIALKLMERHQVDLILLDWEMPGLNGLDVLKTLKEKEITAFIPVIMYTGIMTASRSLQEALDNGSDDFLRKPADPIELRARVRSALIRSHYFQETLKAEKEKYELKVQELSSTLLQISERNNLLSELRKDLESIEQLDYAVRKIINKLDRITEGDNDWDTIRPRIESLHQGFIQQISNLHPDLSHNQIIFCALLRIGLQSKEIARILGVSADAIEKNRYRIRKKLELNPDESLENYLSGISS
jgi:DNA-binding response OmpR family regulator/DNA-binding CsgD family transcriptional regulator